MKPLSLALLVRSSVLGIVVAAAGVTSAQTPIKTTPRGAKSDEIWAKIRTVDAMIQITPLALTKNQLFDLLIAMEKARQKEFDIRKLEDDDLAKFEERLDKAVKEGVEKGQYPPKDLQIDVAKLTKAMTVRRQVALGEMIDIVYDAAQKTLNAGQLKVMENSLKPELLDSRFKSDKMTGEDKIKFFIRSVMMDATCYELLLKLSKVAQN